MYISNLVHKTRFWNNLHQVRSKSKDWKLSNWYRNYTFASVEEKFEDTKGVIRSYKSKIPKG